MTNGGPMQPTFDGPWRARALAGDPDAVRALADGALPALYRFCLYRVGRDVHLCEEVVQETLVRALRDLPRYDPGRADNQILPWLTGLARNAIQRALNRRRATVPLDALWARRRGATGRLRPPRQRAGGRRPARTGRDV
jgi:DNA-directed RNA polymerase specialized sigma24 family protein